jgi:t-SNARE complex subunit (syntaxin)
MGDIAYWDDELADKLRELEAQVGKLKALSGTARESAVAACDAKAASVATTRRTFNMELRQLTGAAKGSYAAKLAGYDAKAEQLAQDVKFARRDMEEQQRAALLRGAADRAERGEGAATAAAAGGAAGQAAVSRDDLLKASTAVQDKTEAALQRTLMSINEANDIGDATLQKLAEQTEQIKRIDEQVTDIASELDRAKDVMTSFLKRASTDKLILVFVVLIILCVVGLVIFIAVIRR